MTDLRTQLRAELDQHVAAPDAVERAVHSGRRSKRQRAIALTMTGALLVAGGLGLSMRSAAPDTALVPSTATRVDRLQFTRDLREGDFAAVRAALSPELNRSLSDASLAALSKHADGDVFALGTRDVYFSGGLILAFTDGKVSLLMYAAPNDSDAYRLVIDFARGRFGENREVAALLGEAAMKSTWQLMLDDSGPVVEVAAAHTFGRTTVVPLTLDHGTAELTLRRGADGKVAGLTLLKTDPVLKPITRSVVADLAAHRWSAVRGRFDDRMTSSLSEADLAAAWEQVVALNGAFLDVVSVRTARAEGATVQTARCRFARGDADVQIAYDDGHRISGLYLRPA